MPLSPPAARKLSHTRVVTCTGYERDDGLWDIEGHIVDTKAFSFSNRDRGGRIEAGEPLHGMWVRLTIDLDMNIHQAEQCTDYSPYNYCTQVEHFTHHLIGERIGPGWTKKIKELMGGRMGCTHITELLIPMATTAYQTLVSAKAKKADGDQQKTTSAKTSKSSQFAGSCHALQPDSPVVKQHWPQYYQPKQP